MWLKNTTKLISFCIWKRQTFWHWKEISLTNDILKSYLPGHEAKCSFDEEDNERTGLVNYIENA